MTEGIFFSPLGHPLRPSFNGCDPDPALDGLASNSERVQHAESLLDAPIHAGDLRA
jgi:hypothetical protein